MALIWDNRSGENAGELGLNCTADGVFLARTPLLRKTSLGFAPRRIEELTGLVRSAYGGDAEPERLYRGLTIIAEALNRGDIGRAMVAAIHLRLGDLDKQGAARVTAANDAINKYNPGELRDERGRWTTGGASPGHDQAKPVRPKRRVKPKKIIRPAKRRLSSGPPAMRPILVSNPGGPRDLAFIESYVVNMTLSRQCVHNANEPNYFRKTQACAAVMQQCEWLINANADHPLRRDACLWPDGAAAIMKFGVLVPFKVGHPF